ncbi:MAG: signal peptidase II [Candidatus Kapabacteria bacterium]|nr:signal peptidase II [Candidatus Kapabacteria bacterium]
MRRDWLVVGGLLALDQVTKLLVKGFRVGPFVHEGMRLGESLPVLGDWVRITFVENPGIAFGLPVGEAKVLLTLFSLTVSIGLGWYLRRLQYLGIPFRARLSVVLLLAGATGNFIDRAFYGVLYGEAPLLQGSVVDFIDVEFPDFELFGRLYTRWPVFNVADSCLTIGVLLALLFHRHLPTLRQALRKV